MSFLNLNISGGLMGSKANDKLEQSSAANKHQLLQGVEGLWIRARRDNLWYILNKIVSMTIAFIFAGITLSFKKTTQTYLKQFLEASGKNTDTDGTTTSLSGYNEASHILTIYWFLFIYLCMSGMDEMIELFSVLN